MSPEALMTVREAARRLRVHENTIRRYADRGLIRAVRLPSGVRRLQREDVESLALRAADEPGAAPSGGRAVGNFEELAASQGVKPTPSLAELAAPEIWRSNAEVDAFLAMTYAERDRDR